MHGKSMSIMRVPREKGKRATEVRPMYVRESKPRAAATTNQPTATTLYPSNAAQQEEANKQKNTQLPVDSAAMLNQLASPRTSAASPGEQTTPELKRTDGKKKKKTVADLTPFLRPPSYSHLMTRKKKKKVGGKKKISTSSPDSRTPDPTDCRRQGGSGRAGRRAGRPGRRWGRGRRGWEAD